MAAAVDEIAKQVKVDRRRVVAVSWSSSGPACWRMLTEKVSPGIFERGQLVIEPWLDDPLPDYDCGI